MGDITADGSKWSANTAVTYRRNVAWFVAKLARNRVAVKEVDRSLSSKRRILATNTAAVTACASTYSKAVSDTGVMYLAPAAILQRLNESIGK
jgi:hypothetical protein